MATPAPENACVGDFPSHLVQAPDRPRFGRAKAAAIGVVTLGMCLLLAGATPVPVIRSPAFSIAGMGAIGSPPAGPSWAPQPVRAGALRMLATASGRRFALHTVAGDETFLPGVNLGGTTPGHQPGELSISAAQYRSWFARWAGWASG